jgi:perosamine synthetase
MSRAAATTARITAPDVPHSRPCLGRDEEEAARRALASGMLAPGPEAAEAAARLARLSGCGAAVLLSSGTTALTLALRALGVGPRDSVAIPSYACAAILHAVRAAPARPLLCDIDPGTLALDPEDVARRSRGRARAAVLVHPFGVPAGVDPFRARGLLVVEDCAQALGGSDRGAPVGSRGDASVFSFAPTKIVTCGGPGGGLASPRIAIVDEARDLAQHDGRDDDRPRTNGLMGDLHAAIASAQMARLAEFRARRLAIARLYDDALARHGLARAPAPDGVEPIVYRYLVRVPAAPRLIEALNRVGIGARRPVDLPLHRLTRDGGDFPHTERAQRTLVSLPLYPALSDAEVGRVITEVRRCLS